MSILHFKILKLFLSIFSSSESFYFKLPPRLRYIKIQRKFVKIVIFCNAMVCCTTVKPHHLDYYTVRSAVELHTKSLVIIK